MLNLKNQEVIKDRIRKCFEGQNDQGCVIINLYRMVFPEWDRIESIKGHPEIGNALWEFICGEFIAFDKKHHQDCFSGGAWLDWGFSVDYNLDPWGINLKNTRITYHS